MALAFDSTSQSLEASLDLRLKRQELLSSNMANIDTPNFKPNDLAFEGFLTEAQGDGPTGANASEIAQSTEGTQSLDGNGVDLDTEVGKMAENTMRYDTALELMRRKLAVMRYAAGMGSNG